MDLKKVLADSKFAECPGSRDFRADASSILTLFRLPYPIVPIST